MCLTVRLLLRNKAKKEVGEAFGRLKAGGGWGLGGAVPAAPTAQETAWGGTQLSWTEVPPTPFSQFT
jgi:hypothetical protein